MKTLAIDIETYSSVSLQKCGVYAYAQSPDFEILLFGYAWDDGPVEVINGKKVCYAGNYRYIEPAESAPCEAEVCRDLPYDCQTFVRGFDGACYNEICEFTFDDEKTGHGYYYQMNKDATA